MEKLILPFDYETWIGLIFVFSLAIIAIFIVNRFPKNFKKLIFENLTKTPTFDILQTFFGVSDRRSPKQNFSRIILTFFIFWCLVMRTAYQGKLFEFTTTAIEKLELKTLDDLRARNYTLYSPDFLKGRVSNYHFQEVIKYM